MVCRIVHGRGVVEGCGNGWVMCAHVTVCSAICGRGRYSGTASCGIVVGVTCAVCVCLCVCVRARV
jgi:hypothetical protein